MILKKSLMVASALGALAVAIASGGCSSNGGSGMDGGAMDATDPMADTGVKDTGKMDKMNIPDNNTGPVCPTPDSMAAMGFTPMYVPPNPASSACNDAAIAGYWDNCRKMGATQQMCTAWVMANMPCATCLESARTDAAWGPLVIGNGVISLNIPGCVALKGDNNCAQAYEALDGCQRAACDMICPVMDNQSFADWQKCTQTASTGVCKTYNDGVTMKCLGDASAAYNACRNGWNSFDTGYPIYAKIFCGAGGGGG
jgi:hypothetical protein